MPNYNVHHSGRYRMILLALMYLAQNAMSLTLCVVASRTSSSSSSDSSSSESSSDSSSLLSSSCLAAGLAGA